MKLVMATTPALAKCGEFLFESVDERPTCEGTIVRHLLHLGIDLGSERLIPESDIEKMDLHG
jgi:hypothetical protein